LRKKVLKYFLLILFITASQTPAQFYFFGRNKVQYEKFNWKVIKTDHFNIYYYDDFGEIAEIGASYAEEVFDELKIKFNHVVTRKIPLVFYNTHIHFQQTNITPGFIPEGVGGFFEFLKGRVVIPYLGNIEQFRHVIRHELVHVFMTSKIYNVLRDHRVQTGRLPPLWFTEGLAEYWSYEWDTQAEMIMRDAILNDNFATLQQMIRIRGSYLMYKEGQIFLEYVSEVYGEDKILELLENFWRFPKFTENLEYTLGESIEDIDNKWVYSLKQRYYPLYEDKHPHFINTKKLTDHGYNFSPQYCKVDTNEFIYFIGNHDGYSSVFRLPYQADSKEMPDPEIVVRGEKEKLFEAFHIMKPSITTTDSGYVAFITKYGGSDALHLFSIEKNEVINSFQFDQLIGMSGPSFSNDAAKIVFSGNDKKGFSDIFILTIATGELKRITNDYYDDKNPIFGKDDDEIIFASDRTERPFERKYNLFKHDLETFEINYLTFTDANISTPHFNPDYSELYFNCDYDGTNNIWKLEYDEENKPSGMTQYTHYLTSVFNFTFTDQTTIVTSGFEKFSFQFYNLDLETIPDSVKKYTAFDFDLMENYWTAPKIEIDPQLDKVEYEKEYTLDYAVSQVSTDPIYGARGGALFLLSDLLSDDKYLFLLYNNAEVQSEILDNFNVAISKLNTAGRTNFAYGVFHFSGRRYDLRESDEFFFERSYGGYFSAIYPLSIFQRIETSISLANSDKQFFAVENDEQTTDFIARKALLLSNTVSFVHDNSLWGPTGPLDGSRFRALLAYTSDIKFSNVNYYSFILDYRHYFRLSLRSTLAARLSLYVNDGKEARRYFGGGSWDIRGWRRWSIRGQKLWVSSLELRFPLIDQFYIRFPFFGLGFTSIRGALFFDAGSAWDKQYRQTYGSIGGGIRINFLNAITFRYDVGKKIENNFQDFQPKLFYQFFFGWDF
jgi:hypothetical protein